MGAFRVSGLLSSLPMQIPLSHTRRSQPFAARLLAMPLFLAQVPPRGDGGVADDKDKEVQNLTNLLARHNNDANSLARDLLGENAKLRRERADLREENTKLTAKVPADGTLVLSGDDVKAWQAYKDQTGQGAVLIPKAEVESLEGYKKLGALDVVTKELTDGKAASETNATRSRADSLVAVAKFGNGEKAFKPGLLKLATKDLDVQMREVDVTDAQGKVTKQERPFVVSKGGDKEKLTPFNDHLKAQGEDVIPSLIDTENDSSAVGNGGGEQQQQQNNGGGINFPAQGGGNKTGTLNTKALDNFSANRYGHNLPQKAAA